MQHYSPLSVYIPAEGSRLRCLLGLAGDVNCGANDYKHFSATNLHKHEQITPRSAA